MYDCDRYVDDMLDGDPPGWRSRRRLENDECEEFEDEGYYHRRYYYRRH